MTQEGKQLSIFQLKLYFYSILTHANCYLSTYIFTFLKKLYAICFNNLLVLSTQILYIYIDCSLQFPSASEERALKSNMEQKFCQWLTQT